MTDSLANIDEGGQINDPPLSSQTDSLWSAICLFNLYKVHEPTNGELIDRHTINMIDYRTYCLYTLLPIIVC